MKQHTVSVVDSGRSPLSVIVLLAWPIFLEQVLVALVQSIDTAMVGSLGAAATASVSISQNPINLINSVILALGVGFTTMIARAVGAGQLDYARTLIRQAILVVIALGLPLSVMTFCLARQIPQWMGAEAAIIPDAAAYIRIIALSMLFRGMMMVLTAIYRGFGDSHTPMLVNGGINLFNIIGNYLLIYPTHTVQLLGREWTIWGAGWGVSGAAASTSLAEVAGALVLLALCFTRSGPMHISPRDNFRPQWGTLREVFTVSTPIIFERFTTSGAFVVTSAIIASLGTVSIAANSLAAQAESLSFMPGFAFGTAVTTLVGQSLGAQRVPLANRYVRLTCVIGSIVMFFTGCVLFLGSEHIIALFTPDPEVIRLGGILLRILALIQVPQVLAMIWSGALKGAGDTRSPFLIILVSMWGVRILGSFVLVHFFGRDLPWVCAIACVDNVVRCGLFWRQMRRSPWVLSRRQLAEAGADA